MEKLPKVSVFMVTYNHEKYIRQAIESVVLQVTDFKFELIISEDHSTDKTKEIIQEYFEKYPNIIKPIYNAKNVGALNNFSKIIEVCRGEYTAILDGDDYWTSFNKLQQQVEFMNQNNSYSISYHKTKAFYEDGEMESFSIPAHKNEVTRLTIIDLFNDYFLPSSSVMFRTGLIDKLPSWYFDMPFGDRPLYILNAHFGDIGYIDKEMSAYRLHQGGIWSLSHFKRMEYYLLKKIEMLKYFNQYFQGIYEREIQIAISRYKTSLLVEKGNDQNTAEITDSLKEKIDDIILIAKKVSASNRKIIIFGTGEMARSVLEICSMFDMEISYFVDNNSSKWGEQFFDIDIVSPECLLNEDSSEIIILVASMYYRQISNQLISMSFKENEHFIFGLDLDSFS